MIVNVNGIFLETAEARTAVSDGAFLFGDTLFETLKARAGRILFRDDHLDRIELAARLLAFPFDRARAAAALHEAAGRLSAPVARLRLTISRGPFAGLDFPPAEAGYFVVTASAYAEPTEADRAAGVACAVAPNRRVNPLSHLPQMKRGNYADCLYAAAFARRCGAREALFVTEAGLVLEGATSNLFLVRGDSIATPPAGELVLPGVMRRQALRAASRLGLRAEEREIALSELLAADEVFLTNALIDLLPVAGINGQPCRRGMLWRKLLIVIEEPLNA